MSVEVKQIDQEAARQFILDEWPSWDTDHQTVSAALMVVLAAHRRQAEEAMRKRAAALAEQRLSVCEDLAWQARFAVFEALPDAIRSIDTRGE
ncbi:hypothetical protein [Sphingomonas sp. NIC1]|uniref:hypothetical protein n=1 Tax=Sphingomonas sp. NIC1 TaxID=1961362 RepID=UPI0007C0FB80|nr:hypothetical protein [Sphingomonas sp. NIC1]ANC87299.1 hypothetical protein A7E77_10560 [Sphingomonas sp. NIC1]